MVSIIAMKEEIIIVFAFTALVYIILCPGIAVCNAANQCEGGVPGELSLLLVNASTGYFVEGGTCNALVYDSGWNDVTVNGTLVEQGFGIYKYALTGSEVSDLGKHMIEYECAAGSDIVYAGAEYDVVTKLTTNSTTDIESKVNILNTTSNSIEAKVDSLNSTLSSVNSTYFSDWNTMFNYWNITTLPDLTSKVNITWYNVVTPASNMIVNVLNYLDGKLTTTLSELTMRTISQNTWNTTITGPKSVEITPGCRNIPAFNVTSGRWGTSC